MIFNRKHGIYVIVVCCLLTCVFCGGPSKAKDEAIYSFKLQKTSEIIVSQAHACASQLRSYWAVWEYAKASEIDFETAAKQMQGGQRQQNLAMMRENKAEIDRMMTDLKTHPDEFAEAYQKLEELYAAYMEMHKQALEPSGDWENLGNKIGEMEDNVQLKKSELDAKLAVVTSESQKEELP
jgi:hypothetical protein